MGQPQVDNASGVILTVGGVSGVDRCACVFPIFADSSALNAINICEDAITAFRNNVLPSLLACMSSSASVTFIQAESMIDGVVPAREDYAIGAHPGTRSAGAMPGQVAALTVYYEDPNDTAPNFKTGVGKNFIWGIADADVTGDLIASALVTLLTTFSALLLNGWTTTASGGTWYRGLARTASRTAGTFVKRIIQAVVRDYVATQRRRLLPRN